MAPPFSSAPSATLIFGRLAPRRSASSLWVNPSSSGTRRPGGRLPTCECDQQKSGQADLQRVERDPFQPFAGVSQPPAQERDQGVANTWIPRPQLTKGVALERVGADRGQRGRFRAARPAIEHCDLADEIAGRGDLEAQFPAVAGRDRQANLSFRHQIEMGPGVTAPEQHLAFGEAGRAKPGRAGRQIVGCKSFEKLGACQQAKDAFVDKLRRHIGTPRSIRAGPAPRLPAPTAFIISTVAVPYKHGPPCSPGNSASF